MYVILYTVRTAHTYTRIHIIYTREKYILLSARGETLRVANTTRYGNRLPRRSGTIYYIVLLNYNIYCERHRATEPATSIPCALPRRVYYTLSAGVNISSGDTETPSLRAKRPVLL